MSTHILYEDNTAALTSDTIVLRGFTKFLGRTRRIPLTGIVSFHVRERADFPHMQLPAHGTSDDGVWYTRDRKRFRRQAAIEVTFANGERVGFTPAHAHRVHDLLVAHHVKER